MSEIIKTSDLQDKSVEELRAVLIEQKKAGFNERMQIVTGASAQTHEMRNTRKNIARVKTVINQKRQAAAVAGKAS